MIVINKIYVCRVNGINRNIVECKLSYPLNFRYVTFVLIETLWNVNDCEVAGLNCFGVY